MKEPLDFEGLVKKIGWQWRNLRGWVDREDVEQAARLGVLEAFSRLDRDHDERFGAFVAARANGAARDELRRIDGYSRTDRKYAQEGQPLVFYHDGAEKKHLPSPDILPDEDLWQRERRQLVRRQLDLLPEEDQRILHCLFVLCMSPLEVSRHLLISETTMYVRRGEALDKLRGALVLAKLKTVAKGG